MARAAAAAPSRVAVLDRSAEPRFVLVVTFIQAWTDDEPPQSCQTEVDWDKRWQKILRGTDCY